jgi:hypothetical protein
MRPAVRTVCVGFSTSSWDVNNRDSDINCYSFSEMLQLLQGITRNCILFILGSNPYLGVHFAAGEFN